MEIKAINGKLDQVKADAIIIGYFEGTDNLTGVIAGIDKVLRRRYYSAYFRERN